MEVTFQGEPLEIKGTQPNVGDKAPNATLTARNHDKVQLSDFIKDKPEPATKIEVKEIKTSQAIILRSLDEVKNHLNEKNKI